jgi:uncharacterized delta-60 repeat protein
MEMVEARLLCAAGDLDQTFNGTGIQVFPSINGSNPELINWGPSEIPNSTPAMAIQPDNKVVMAVSIETPTAAGLGIVRLDAAGQPDPTFGNGGLDILQSLGVSGDAVAIQPDGKILVGGSAVNPANGRHDYCVVRLMSNGQLDSGFGTGGEEFFDLESNLSDPSGYPLSMALRPNGDIVVAAAATEAQLTPSGQLDPTFGTGGEAALPSDFSTNASNSLALESNGESVVVGGSFNAAIVFVNVNGTVDSEHTYSNWGAPFAVAVGQNDQIVVGGKSEVSLPGSAFNGFVARVDANGVPDISLGNGGVAVVPGIGFLNAVAIQPDGKILAAGDNINESHQFAVTRLNADGTVDTSFNQGQLVEPFPINQESYATSEGITPDGSKVVVVGYTTQGLAAVRVLLNGTTPTTTTLLASSGSLTYGQSVVLTATVTTNPPSGTTPTGGTVTFLDGSTTLGSTTLANGIAQLSTTNLAAATHTLTAAYSGNGSNFLGSSTPSGQSVAVTPAILTVTARSATKVYGATLPPLTYTIAGFVNGDTASVVSGSPVLSSTATASSHVSGSPYSISISSGTFWDANYSFKLVGANLSISPAPLTITADNKTKVYGAALPTLTASYTGWVNGDTPANLTTLPSISTTASASSQVGSYAITVGAAVSSDYTISYVAGTLTITPDTPTVYTVTNLNDSGSGSLRYAIAQANVQTPNPAGSLIQFAPGLYGQITLSSTLSLSETDGPEVITCPNANLLTVSGNHAVVVFQVNSGVSAEISNLTVSSGMTTSNGGGIYNQGTLTVNNGTFTNNTANNGGGIYNQGTLTVNNSTFTNNSANQGTGPYGGGIYNNGTLTASTCTFAGNFASADGGGILSNWNTTLNVINSTFSTNSAVYAGGGICSFGTATVINTTITSNSAGTGNGPGGVASGSGGIYCYGTMIVTNSTIANNTGAGICNGVSYSFAALTLNNTIVAGNSLVVYGQQPTSSFNLIGDDSGVADVAAFNSSNLIGTAAHPINPMLGPLANNGGPTQTMAPLPGSPAVDAGSSALAVDAKGNQLTTDQRGAGFPRIIGGIVNIGACESSVNQTISFGPLASQTYGVPSITLSAAATSGLPVVLSVISGPATLLGDVLTVIGSGTVVIQASQAGNATFAAASPVDESFIVTPARLTITANNTTKLYGAALPALTASYSGFVNGDTPASLASLPIIGTTASATSHVGSYTITASGAFSPNYTIGYVSGTLSVTPAALTITADNKTKIYGAALPTLTASYNGWINGDTLASLSALPSLSTTASAASHVGSYAITASGAVSGDYAISYVFGSLSVTPAALAITANDTIKVYGASVPALSATYRGFVNGDSAASLTTPPTLNTAATASSHVQTGGFVINASGASDPDYTISYLPGTLTITPAPLTITANKATKTYGAALPALTATYTGFVNGESAASLAALPVLATTASASSPVQPAGYPIIASGASDPDYSVSYQPGTLLVAPAPLTITANNASMVEGAAVPPLSASYSGFVNGDSPASLAVKPTVTTAATSRSPAGTYPIVVGGASSPNYAINYANGILVVTPAPVKILKISIQAIRLGNSTKTTQVIVVQFSGAMNPASAQTISNYTLTTIPTNKSQKSQSVALSQAQYNAKTNTVTLITRKPLVLNPPIRLTLNAARLHDRYGRPLSGKSVATLSKSGVTF